MKNLLGILVTHQFWQALISQLQLRPFLVEMEKVLLQFRLR